MILTLLWENIDVRYSLSPATLQSFFHYIVTNTMSSFMSICKSTTINHINIGIDIWLLPMYRASVILMQKHCIVCHPPSMTINLMISSLCCDYHCDATSLCLVVSFHCANSKEHGHNTNYTFCRMLVLGIIPSPVSRKGSRVIGSPIRFR